MAGASSSDLKEIASGKSSPRDRREAGVSVKEAKKRLLRINKKRGRKRKVRRKR